MTNKILCAGTVPATGLGDALQHAIAIILIHKNFPQAEATLYVPNADISKLIVVPALTIEGIDKTKIKLMYGLHELSSLMYPFLIMKRTSYAPSIAFMYGYQVSKFMPSPIAMVFYNLFRPMISRLRIPEHDVGFIAGHTIEAGAFTVHVTTYSVARAVTKGPLITFPISISLVGLKKSSKLLQVLVKALNKIDKIFVRGKFSHKILSNIIRDERKLEIALDSGFGVRLLYPDVSKLLQIQSKHKFVIGLVPRKDYFYLYGLDHVYMKYLLILSRIIKSLVSKFDVKILLVPHTLKSPRDITNTSDEDTIHDLLNVLDGSIKKYVKVVKPLSILDSVKVLSSCDIVITSRMHAGVISLAYGKPTIFFMPKDDVKMLDILSYLGLDEKRYVIDSFNPKEYEKLIPTTMQVLENLSEESRLIEHVVSKHLPEVEKPVTLLKRLL